MRFALLLLFAAVAHGADAAAPGDGALPVTTDERIAACTAAEDADPARATALAQSVLDQSDLTPMQRAGALGCRGWAFAAQSKRDEARRDAYALRELVRVLEAGADRVRLTRRAGGILHRSGDRIGAVDLYAQAVADTEAQGLEAERIPLLANLAVLHSEFEEHARAQVNYEQALALMERLGDYRYEAPVRFNLGLNLNGEERYAEAVPHLQRALELIGGGMGGPMQAMAANLALGTALQGSGDTAGAQAALDRARAIELPSRDPSLDMELTMIEAGQRAAAGDLPGALALVEGIPATGLTEIQQWKLLGRRATLLERLGRFEDAARVLREINRLRETYLRHQNHERLAALDAHLRDREQRHELERLQLAAEVQARRTEAGERLQLLTLLISGMVLVFCSAMLIWQRRMNRRLYVASHTDSLTGLANRRAMTQRLGALSLDPRAGAAVLLVDIDFFKRINDAHGHDIGDQVLVTYAGRLRSHAGEGAVVARWGGEEFLVLLPRCDAARVAATAERLRVALAQPIATVRGAVQAGASIGYANLPLPGPPLADGWHHSVQLADSALYLAKRAGRDAWVGYWLDATIPDWPAERLGREAQLARSLHLIVPVSSRPLREPVATVAVAH